MRCSLNQSQKMCGFLCKSTINQQAKFGSYARSNLLVKYSLDKARHLLLPFPVVPHRFLLVGQRCATRRAAPILSIRPLVKHNGIGHFPPPDRVLHSMPRPFRSTLQHNIPSLLPSAHRLRAHNYLQDGASTDMILGACSTFTIPLDALSGSGHPPRLLL